MRCLRLYWLVGWFVQNCQKGSLCFCVFNWCHNLAVWCVRSTRCTRYTQCVSGTIVCLCKRMCCLMCLCVFVTIGWFMCQRAQYLTWCHKIHSARWRDLVDLGSDTLSPASGCQTLPQITTTLTLASPGIRITSGGARQVLTEYVHRGRDASSGFR